MVSPESIAAAGQWFTLFGFGVDKRDAGGCPAATSEQVNHQLCVHRQEKLRGKHLGLQKRKSPLGMCRAGLGEVRGF
jgi:hypothetical protein